MYSLSDRFGSASEGEDYTSHNTERLDVEQVVSVLSGLEYIKQELRSNDTSSLS